MVYLLLLEEIEICSCPYNLLHRHPFSTDWSSWNASSFSSFIHSPFLCLGLYF